MTVAVYGIKACDTMKKACRWLDDHGIAYEFHDYKKEGVDPERLKRWVDAVGWEKLLNRSGTTFRRLPDADKTDLNEEKAIALMCAHTSAIRRPVLETEKGVTAGFSPELYETLFPG